MSIKIYVIKYLCAESELWPDTWLSWPHRDLLLHHDNRVASRRSQSGSWTVQLCVWIAERKEVCQWLSVKVLRCWIGCCL